MENLFKHAVPVFLLLVMYLVFSFIAWETNPTKWLLFTTVIGRCWAVFITIFYIKVVFDHYDEY